MNCNCKNTSMFIPLCPDNNDPNLIGTPTCVRMTVLDASTGMLPISLTSSGATIFVFEPLVNPITVSSVEVQQQSVWGASSIVITPAGSNPSAASVAMALQLTARFVGTDSLGTPFDILGTFDLIPITFEVGLSSDSFNASNIELALDFIDSAGQLVMTSGGIVNLFFFANAVLCANIVHGEYVQVAVIDRPCSCATRPLNTVAARPPVAE